ncbi:MAG: hybrid sensor histidine kinase/response regulator [Pseudomonadota bacterium]
MDDLLLEFLTETNESLDVVDVELVKFEQEPNNAQILDNIFRLVHTIKGTCGFLGLPRLESLAHAAETLMGKYRDGSPVTKEGVSLILLSIDRLKAILADLEASGSEPAGDDSDLISELERMSVASDDPAPQVEEAGEPAAVEMDEEPINVLERELKPGEVPLDELDRIFAETPSEFDAEAAAKKQMADALAEVQSNNNESKGEPAEVKPSKAKRSKKTKEAAASAKETAPPAAAPAKAATPPAKAPEKPAAEKSLASQSIRVSVDTLENLMTMVSELVLTRNQLLEIVRRHEDSEFKVPLQRLSNVTAELQEGVMKTRMQPIGNAWQKLPRIVRDLAGELGKQIELDMVGAETELDRQVLDLIKDPLTHMVRNSADHGLEMPDVRAAAGKPEKGTIKLSAYHEGGHIIIEIADDGKGLPTEKLKNKAIDNELYTEAEIERMSEAQIHKLIFHPGLSTAEKVTNVSGRGVGMDVVRTNIEAIGGTIDLKSKEGAGTVVMIKIPLTLAIVSTLIVESAGERFAIPQLAVVELVRAQKNSEHKIETIRNTPVLRLRNKLLPLSPLASLLGTRVGEAAEVGEEGFIVVMQVGNQTFGLVVDAVFHTEEIVVKPMSSMLRHLTMFSGNTILGDGSVIMILDPNGIANAIGSAIDEEVADQAEAEEVVSKGDGEVPVSLLVFRAGGQEPKAVMLSLVTRLEEIQVEAIEHANGRDLVQYRGQLMPLVKAETTMSLQEQGTQPMLVFADEHRSMGLIVDEIVDIVEEVLEIEVTSEKPGLLGSAVIKGKATEVIDVGYFMPLAFDDWFSMSEAGPKTDSFDVLLVDDSSFFRNMLAPVLRAAGYTVTTCHDAHQALETLEDGRRFDAIVSDIEMPGLSGYEFTEIVRRDERYARTPIIAMSAHASPSAVERGREAGFSDYVAKFDRTGLIAALKEQTIETELAA